MFNIKDVLYPVTTSPPPPIMKDRPRSATELSWISLKLPLTLHPLQIIRKAPNSINKFPQKMENLSEHVEIKWQSADI